jgi:hypothetical protein
MTGHKQLAGSIHLSSHASFWILWKKYMTNWLMRKASNTTFVTLTKLGIQNTLVVEKSIERHRWNTLFENPWFPIAVFRAFSIAIRSIGQHWSTLVNILEVWTLFCPSFASHRWTLPSLQGASGENSKCKVLIYLWLCISIYSYLYL